MMVFWLAIAGIMLMTLCAIISIIIMTKRLKH